MNNKTWWLLLAGGVVVIVTWGIYSAVSPKGPPETNGAEGTKGGKSSGVPGGGDKNGGPAGSADRLRPNPDVLKCYPPTFPIPAPDEKPAELDRDTIVQRYPKGRRVRSLANLRIRGKGDNRDWVWKIGAGFLYEYRVLAETTVVNNNGTNVDFEVYFKDVIQERAIVDPQRFSLDLSVIDAPVLETAWEVAEKFLLSNVPGYSALRMMVDLLHDADPKGSLLGMTIKKFVPPGKLAELANVELVQQIESLRGARLKMSYVSGLGVTRVDVLNNQSRFTASDLVRLAHVTGVMSDYFLLRIAQAKVGAEEVVRVQDLAGLFNFYNLQAEGTLNLKRGPDVTTEDGAKLAQINVQGGEIHLTGRDANQELAGKVKVTGGTILFSLKDGLIRKAEFNVDAHGQWQSTDHLLFGTENVRDAQARMVYEAARLPPADQTPAPSPKP